MGWWGKQVLPRAIDRMLDNDEVNALRKDACVGLAGTVLEVGFGSGPNLPHYPAAVDRVLAVEPSDLAWRLAERRRADGGPIVERVGLTGERLELADASIDCALSTFTLCTIPAVDAALTEIRRVLRPGGRLHFLEHGLAPDASVARWQSRLNPVHGRVFGGCHLDRPIADLVSASGLTVRDVRADYAAGFRPFGYLYRGTAG